MKPVIAILAAALALAGCGEKSEPTGSTGRDLEPFTLVLDYFPNADHAGIYAAIESGAFADAKLDVTPRPPTAISVVRGFWTSAPTATTFGALSRASSTSGS